MTTHYLPSALGLGATVLALALAAVSAACGDGAVPVSQAKVQSQASAQPADPQARVLSGRYLSGREAEDLASTRRGDVVWVDVPCCGDAHRDTAVHSAYGMQAAQDLPNDAPFLVRGVNLREAAEVANRLTRGGLTNVMLVIS